MIAALLLALQVTSGVPVSKKPVDSATVLPSIKGTPRPASTPINTVGRPARKYVVVVDAGHGGDASGMTGPIIGGPRIIEKNITLAVSKKVQRNLLDAGVGVVMTRTTDASVGLSERGQIANRSHADIFVSIHVNATGSPRKSWGKEERGYETYFLAEAKTEEAARVAAMENADIKFETDARAAKDDPMSFIINDMAQNEHLRESMDLAEVIQNGFRNFHPGKDRGVKQANFAVLRGSFMPAVLVEIGFGTNTDEAAYLASESGQEAIARSISQAILEYLDHYTRRMSGESGMSNDSGSGRGGGGGNGGTSE